MPVDRHVFVKRIRVWVNADGFLSPLDFKNLASFKAGSPAVWNFVANAGDGRTVEIELRAEMIEGKNTDRLSIQPADAKNSARGKQLPADADVRLTVRVDIEDRNFHSETKRNGGADFHFSSNTHRARRKSPALPSRRRPTGSCASSPTRGEYHPQPEWCENIPHPVEQTRGQTGSGDAYSPGWFELPLAKGDRRHARRHGGNRRSSSPLAPPNGESGRQRSGKIRLKRSFPNRRETIRRPPRQRQDRHRRLSVVSGLGTRLAHLRARPARRRHGGRGETIVAHVRQI